MRSPDGSKLLSFKLTGWTFTSKQLLLTTLTSIQAHISGHLVNINSVFLLLPFNSLFNFWGKYLSAAFQQLNTPVKTAISVVFILRTLPQSQAISHFTQAHAFRRNFPSCHSPSTRYSQTFHTSQIHPTPTSTCSWVTTRIYIPVPFPQFSVCFFATYPLKWILFPYHTWSFHSYTFSDRLAGDTLPFFCLAFVYLSGLCSCCQIVRRSQFQ